MAAARKYEGLPDIDATAPDIYETPDLNDELSTIQDTSARSPSLDSDAAERAAEDEDGSTIDKRQWKAGDARSTFRPSRVKADDVDFSDRLNQRSYKTYASRKRRGTYDEEPEEYGVISDDEDENLDQKLARLQREVEQLKASIDEGSSSGSTANNEDSMLEGIEKLSDALDSMYTKRHGGAAGAEAELSQTISRLNQISPSKQAVTAAPKESKGLSITSEPHVSQVLSKTADFDARLSFLESSLGISGLNMPDSTTDFNKPILPSLITLERSIQIVTAQPSALEAAHSKTRQFLKDAERVSRQRNLEDGDTSEHIESSNGLNAEQVSKINALYGLLPTIDSISPHLPLVLDRLRTLQLLHANASDASEVLDEIEKRHMDQAEEISAWRQALEKIESNLDENESTLAENVGKMGSWVRELEARAAT